MHNSFRQYPWSSGKTPPRSPFEHSVELKNQVGSCAIFVIHPILNKNSRIGYGVKPLFEVGPPLPYGAGVRGDLNVLTGFSLTPSAHRRKTLLHPLTGGEGIGGPSLRIGGRQILPGGLVHSLGSGFLKERLN